MKLRTALLGSTSVNFTFGLRQMHDMMAQWLPSYAVPMRMDWGDFDGPVFVVEAVQKQQPRPFCDIQWERHDPLR